MKNDFFGNEESINEESQEKTKIKKDKKFEGYTFKQVGKSNVYCKMKSDRFLKFSEIPKDAQII